MSRYTYAGPYKNPTTGWFIKEVEVDGNIYFTVWIRNERKADGSCEPDRPHTSRKQFPTWEDANEYIQDLESFYEEDYEEYLEENHDELARMEAYEQWRNEY